MWYCTVHVLSLKSPNNIVSVVGMPVCQTPSKNIQPLTSSLTPMPKKLIRDVQIHTLLFKLRRGHDPLRAMVKFLVGMAFMILKIIWRD